MTGSGTALDPYVIWDVTDLQNINLDLTAYYELGQNIDASATVGWNGGAGFIPVGNVVSQFRGSFNGVGFTISNLFINRPLTDYVGLFGYTRGARIQNVTLSNVDITGDDETGSLIGEIFGNPSPCTITNCASSGTINGDRWVGGLIGFSFAATLTGCHSSCTVTATNNEIGGLIGQFDGEDAGILASSYATGAVTGDSYVGGLIGEMLDCIVEQCYATGNVSGTVGVGGTIGGFVGVIDAAGTIRNSYSCGDVSALTFAGGFISQNIGGTIENCYSTGVVSGGAGVGGFCESNTGTITGCYWDTETSGQATSAGGTGKTTAEMKMLATFLDPGWDIEARPLDKNNGYPYLAWQSVWHIFVAAGPPPAISVVTLAATEIR